MQIFLLVVVLTLSLRLTPSEAASYPVLYVKSNGMTSWPCGTQPTLPCRMISTAIANANSGATTTIRVAQGDYPEFVEINASLPLSSSETLTIEGGWNGDFTFQSKDSSLTKITPESTTDPIITISPGTWQRVSLRFKNLKFQGVFNGHRQGIKVGASASIANIAIEECFIGAFRGNGIYVLALSDALVSVTIDATTFEGNFQFPDSDWWDGGAVSLLSDNSVMDAIITNSRIIGNQGQGGGESC